MKFFEKIRSTRKTRNFGKFQPNQLSGDLVRRIYVLGSTSKKSRKNSCSKNKFKKGDNMGVVINKIKKNVVCFVYYNTTNTHDNDLLREAEIQKKIRIFYKNQNFVKKSTFW